MGTYDLAVKQQYRCDAVVNLHTNVPHTNLPPTTSSVPDYRSNDAAFQRLAMPSISPSPSPSSSSSLTSRPYSPNVTPPRPAPCALVSLPDSVKTLIMSRLKREDFRALASTHRSFHSLSRHELYRDIHIRSPLELTHLAAALNTTVWPHGSRDFSIRTLTISWGVQQLHPSSVRQYLSHVRGDPCPPLYASRSSYEGDLRFLSVSLSAILCHHCRALSTLTLDFPGACAALQSAVLSHHLPARNLSRVRTVVLRNGGAEFQRGAAHAPLLFCALARFGDESIESLTLDGGRLPSAILAGGHLQDPARKAGGYFFRVPSQVFRHAQPKCYVGGLKMLSELTVRNVPGFDGHMLAWLLSGRRMRLTRNPRLPMRTLRLIGLPDVCNVVLREALERVGPGVGVLELEPFAWDEKAFLPKAGLETREAASRKRVPRTTEGKREMEMGKKKEGRKRPKENTDCVDKGVKGNGLKKDIPKEPEPDLRHVEKKASTISINTPAPVQHEKKKRHFFSRFSRKAKDRLYKKLSSSSIPFAPASGSVSTETVRTETVRMTRSNTSSTSTTSSSSPFSPMFTATASSASSTTTTATSPTGHQKPSTRPSSCFTHDHSNTSPFFWIRWGAETKATEEGFPFDAAAFELEEKNHALIQQCMAHDACVEQNIHWCPVVGNCCPMLKRLDWHGSVCSKLFFHGLERIEEEGARCERRCGEREQTDGEEEEGIRGDGQGVVGAEETDEGEESETDSVVTLTPATVSPQTPEWNSCTAPTRLDLHVDRSGQSAYKDLQLLTLMTRQCNPSSDPLTARSSSSQPSASPPPSAASAPAFTSDYWRQRHMADRMGEHRICGHDYPHDDGGEAVLELARNAVESGAVLGAVRVVPGEHVGVGGARLVFGKRMCR